MRRSLMVLLGAAACTPVVAVAALFGAAHFAWMDRMSLAMPTAIRVPIAQIAMSSAGYGKDSAKKIDRVIRIDPESPDGWARRCDYSQNPDARDNPAVSLQTCRKALALHRSEDNFNGIGMAQEELKDYCTAEESFTRANSMVNARDSYVLRNMGRAALECGNAPWSVANFEVAEEVDAKNTEDEEDKDDLKLDREWLIVAYTANHDPQAVKVACGKVHPDWKRCACVADGYSVRCNNAQ